MIQLRQGSLFAGETLAAGGGKPGIPQDFDGDEAAEIVALGKVDKAHASFA